ncbi:MAG: hypothetical protein WB580_02030 [Candidatus Binataceae bacterium]
MQAKVILIGAARGVRQLTYVIPLASLEASRICGWNLRGLASL